MRLRQRLAKRPRPAYACSCVPGTEQESYANADLVFSGVVTRISPPPLFNTSTLSERGHFRVEHVWKGNVPSSITLANIAGFSCGYEDYVKGGRFLVFARLDSVLLPNTQLPLADMCSGTRPLDLDPLGAPITELGEPEPPLAGAAADRSTREAMLIGALGMLAVAGLTVVARRVVRFRQALRDDG